MLLTLGDFVFELSSLPFQSRELSHSYTWAEQEPVNAAPVYQFLGAGVRTLTLDGVLYPELTGGPLSLAELRDLAAQGKPQLMMDGRGFNQGLWFIEQISETASAFFADGAARKIEFQISLKFFRDSSRDLYAGEPANIADNVA